MVRLEVLPAVLPVMPDIFALLAALVLLVLAFLAAHALGPILEGLANVAPVGGGWFRDRAQDVERWAAATAQHAVTQVVQAFLAILTRIEWVMRVLSISTAHGSESLFNAIVHVEMAVLPRSTAQLQAMVNAVEGYLGGQIASVLHYVQQQLGPIPGLIQGIVNAAIANLRASINAQLLQLTHAEQAALNALGVYTAAQIEQVAVAAQRELSAEAARAQAAEQATLAAASSALTDAERLILERVYGPGGAVKTLEGEFTTGNAATLASALAGAAALARPLELAIDDIKNLECIKACAPLGQLGNELQALDLAAVVALLVLVAADPKAATALVKDTLGTVVDDGAKVFRSVLGR